MSKTNTQSGPILDIRTKNLSFLATVHELKTFGVKNYAFFLRLNDPSLVGVDPFDENLSNDMKGRILKEVMTNPWYYFREVTRIPVPGRKSGIRFKLHRGNLALLWCLLNNLNTIIVLPRQNYKTVSACCYYGYQFEFGTESSVFTFGNKEYGDAKKNLRIMKDILLLNPEWLTFRQGSQDQNNIEFYILKHTKNEVKTISCGKDPEHADTIGRGLTAPNEWWDEFSFLRYNQITYNAAAPAFSEAADMAKSNGRCYGKLISTTPNNTDLASGRYCKDLINMAADFTEKMYDMDRTEIDEFVDRNSSNDFVYIFFDYKQLRRGPQWFRSQCRNLNNELDVIRREILCAWSPSSDVNPFSDEEILEIENFQRDPISTVMLQGFYELQYFAELQRGINYLTTVDVAGGLDRDSSAIVLSDPDSLETVACLKNNKISTAELEDALRELHRMYPDVIFIIERNSYGLNIIQRFEKEPDLKKSLFYTETKTKAEKLSKSKKGKRVYGINTTSTTRPLIIECIKTMVSDMPEVLVAKAIIDDVKTLEMKKSNKIEHANGEHDDAIFSKAFALYVKDYHWETLKRFLKGGRSAMFKAVRRISVNNRRNDGRKDSSRFITESEVQLEKRKPKKEETFLAQVIALNKGDSKKGPSPLGAVRTKPVSGLGDYLEPQPEEENNTALIKHR